LRRSMESSFGADFKDVRLHTGTESVQMSRELSAEAFTHGRDIFFGAGRFNPGSRAGKQLLTHELTHVVQQNPDVTSNVQTKRDKGIQVPIKRMDAAQVQRKGFWNAF